MLKFFRKMKAQRMNKIVDEVTRQIEEKMDFLFEDFICKMNGQLLDLSIPECDYRELAGHIDYYDIAEHIDESAVANYISDCDVAYHIDVHDVASAINIDDIAREFDTYTIAQEIDISDIVDEIDLDDLLDDARRDILGEVEGMISDAIDDLQITRG